MLCLHLTFSLAAQTEVDWDADRKRLLEEKEEAVRLLVDEATAREEELQALVVELQGNLENIADFKQRKEDVETELVGGQPWTLLCFVRLSGFPHSLSVAILAGAAAS